MNNTTRDEPMRGLADYLRMEAAALAIGAPTQLIERSRETLIRWAEAVESRRAACSSLPDEKPAAWLCEFQREDDTADTQVVLEDPEGTRWADVPDGDGVSPFKVTPLYRGTSGERVWIVATGQVFEDRETYTRHDKRPPMCDAELLWSHAAGDAR